jgi:hypothetical protein
MVAPNSSSPATDSNSPTPDERKQVKSHRVRDMPEYQAWRQMIYRCTNPRSKAFHRYGGRGITVCERWRRSFWAFYEDVGPRPTPDHSIDRHPDNDGDYEPGNTCWSTSIEQTRNRSGNVFLEYKGRRMVVADWAAELGVTHQAICYRIRMGWSADKTIETPFIRRKELRYRGVRPDRGRWTVRISYKRRTKYVGTFDSEIEAAFAYDEAARELLGDHARTNFTSEESLEMKNQLGLPRTKPIPEGPIGNMVTLGLSEKQARVFLRLFQMTMETGTQPSFLELREQFGMRSTHSIVHYMKILAQKGWIRAGSIHSRSVEFLLEPDGRPFRGFVLPEDTP